MLHVVALWVDFALNSIFKINLSMLLWQDWPFSLIDVLVPKNVISFRIIPLGRSEIVVLIYATWSTNTSRNLIY